MNRQRNTAARYAASGWRRLIRSDNGDIAAGLADPAWTWLSDAVTAYLDLVEATL